MRNTAKILQLIIECIATIESLVCQQPGNPSLIDAFFITESPLLPTPF